MMLLKEVINILLAIIAILALFMLVSNLWGAIVGSTEKQQADAMLIQISNTLESIKQGQSDSMYVYVPKGLFLVTISNNVAPKDVSISNECYATNCICICDEKCEKSVYCKTISKPLKKDGNLLKNKIPLNLIVTNNTNEFSASEAIQDTSNEGEVQIISDKCYGDLVSLSGGPCNVETDSQDKCIRQSVKPIFDKAVEIAKNKSIVLTVTSAYRTQTMQEILWENSKNAAYVCKPSLNCPHQTGCALDVCFGDLCKSGMSPQLNNEETKLLESIMAEAGFVRYTAEYWHFEYGTTRWQTCKLEGKIAC